MSLLDDQPVSILVDVTCHGNDGSVRMQLLWNVCELLSLDHYEGRREVRE